MEAIVKKCLSRKGHVAVSRLEEDHDAHDEEEQSQQDRQPPAGDVGANGIQRIIQEMRVNLSLKRNNITSMLLLFCFIYFTD